MLTKEYKVGDYIYYVKPFEFSFTKILIAAKRTSGLHTECILLSLDAEKGSYTEETIKMFNAKGELSFEEKKRHNYTTMDGNFSVIHSDYYFSTKKEAIKRIKELKIEKIKKLENDLLDLENQKKKIGLQILKLKKETK